MEMNLTLPVPVSLNQLYINEYRFNPKFKKNMPTGKRILSKEGRQCKNEIQAETRVQMQGQDWDFNWTKEGYLYLDTTIYFARKGTDDNNIYKLLCDALEDIVYDNDSRVLVRTQKIMYSSHDPRVEVKLTPVEYVGVFDSPDQASKFENKCSSCSRYRKGSCSILKDSLDYREREEVDIETKTCTSYKKKKTS